VIGSLVAASLGTEHAGAEAPPQRGAQRLSLEQLKRWEALGYGMFIHFGMSTYDGKELSDGKSPASLYAPDALDVDQWVSVARDAGMRYAVLTAKHVAGHCLWPSRHTAYTVANSGNTSDVCERFVDACGKRGVLPGFYYCSWDNHNRFGSGTPSDKGYKWGNWAGVPAQGQEQAPFTTSVYQNFQTLQLTELLTQYGPIAETWIDIPGVLGLGYRDYLYRKIAQLQPETVVMMNSGIGSGETYDTAYAWPSDLIAIERELPPGGGHRKWREIEGASYYLPGEICDPIGKEWFWVEGDAPRPDEQLLALVEASRSRGVNLLLDVPPDRHGRIPGASVQALVRLRKNAGL
jgi:alpha-L-fucosidase